MTLIYNSNQIFGQNNFPWLTLTRHYIFFKFPDFPQLSRLLVILIWFSLTFQSAYTLYYIDLAAFRDIVTDSHALKKPVIYALCLICNGPLTLYRGLIITYIKYWSNLHIDIWEALGPLAVKHYRIWIHLLLDCLVIGENVTDFCTTSIILCLQWVWTLLNFQLEG